MSFLKTIRGNMRADGPDAASAETGSTDRAQTLTDRYAKLNERQAVAELARLNQTELTAIEQFERSHREREPLLNKLRYLRQPEPLPGYDGLEPDGIAEALAEADAETVKAVREYERKFRNRPTVNVAIAVAIHRLRDRPAAGADGSLAPASASERAPAAGDGLPIKVRPESGLGTP
jgi:hypothetical protein